MPLHQLRYRGEPHHQELELLSALALEEGDVDAAWRLADRRCRIKPLPEAHCYVLRAEALMRMGDTATAVADLETALQIAPDDLGANRRMLAWGHPRQRTRAAHTLVNHEHDASSLKKALAILAETDETAVARLESHGSQIEGWAAWRDDGDVSISIAGEDGCAEIVLAADPRHPLTDESWRASQFSLPLQPSCQLQTVFARKDGRVIASLRIARDGRPARANQTVASDAEAPVTVIIPVYGDHRATKTCLASLVEALGDGPHRAIVVDDASPDPRIAKLLDRLPSETCQVVRNAANNGFAAAVNRALQLVTSGDVILLNADTVVPQGFVERLTAVARSSPDIGTITPLSNNGEFTSFPIPNQPNVGGDPAVLDRIAAEVNAATIVDLPNGIGFCLYVTRACLDAIGPLSESYRRGYFEDVDFCLRARQHGFRNVCAPSVYVHHAGSRSFGKQKRSLVVRNLAVIEERFPDYRTECADFVLADPLKTARRAIETQLLSARAPGVLLVAVGDAVAEVAHVRSQHLQSDRGRPVMILTVRSKRGIAVATLRDGADAVPQSLDFDLPMSGQPVELLNCLRRARIERIEFLDLARLPRDLLDGLRELGCPYDVLVAHGDLWSDASLPRDVIDGAAQILAPDEQAQAAANSLASERHVVRLDHGRRSRRAARWERDDAARLGLVPVRRDASEQAFMHDVIVGLKESCPHLEIIVTASALDDLSLLRLGNTSVTGMIDPDELALTFRRYRVDRLLLCLTRPLFGHPVTAAVIASRLPTAQFDWSAGQYPAAAGDLLLCPTQSIDRTTGQLGAWLKGTAAPQ